MANKPLKHNMSKFNLILVTLQIQLNYQPFQSQVSATLSSYFLDTKTL